ncbi:Melanoma-associated antigen D2 [Irineochytrium annulatum]|nr:Melanoma-associated antigen D2 [Irineochytrium annulatum]
MARSEDESSPDEDAGQQARRGGARKNPANIDHEKQLRGLSAEVDFGRSAGYNCILPSGCRKHQEIERKVKALVRLALCAERKRNPIKREDLTKGLENKKEFPALMIRANVVLKATFGLELVNLPNKNAGKENIPGVECAAPARGKGKAIKSDNSTYYAVVSVMDVAETSGQFGWGEETPRMVFVCIVLGIVHLSGRNISEEILFRRLEALDIHRDRDHPKLGKINQLYDSLIKQGYLAKQKVVTPQDAPGTTNYNLWWGPRANVEFGEKGLLGFVGELFPEMNAAALKIQVDRAAM